MTATQCQEIEQVLFDVPKCEGYGEHKFYRVKLYLLCINYFF